MPKYKGVYKRKNKKGKYTWYAYVQFNKKKKHIPGGYPTAEKAREAQERYLKKLKSSLPPEKENVTVKDFAILFLNRFKNRWRKGTFVNKESYLRNYIVAALGSKKIVNVNEDDIQQVVDLAYSRGNDKRYIYDVLSFTKRFFEIAMHWGYTERNPAYTVELPKVPKRAKPHIPPAKVVQMINDTKSIRDKSIMALCFYGLLRIGEALSLQWIDIDFQKKIINIERRVYRKEIGEPKTASSKDTIYMIKLLEIILKELRLKIRSENWLFQSKMIRNKPINYESWYKSHFAKICKAHNIKLGTHDLRRLGGQFYRELGVPLEVIQRQMRHAIITTTADIYTEVTEKMLEEGLSSTSKDISKIIEPDYEIEEVDPG